MTDSELVDGLRREETNAQKIFWDIYRPKVFGICQRILGNASDAMDLTVDLLTEFMDRRVHDIKKPGATGGYLRLMAVRQALEIKKKRQNTSSLNVDVMDIDSESPEKQAELTALSQRLEHCLEQLTEKARQTLRLKYSEEWPNERIGQIVGGSRQYIGRLINQSLKCLRGCIEKNQRVAPLESK
jgi:RNA polymerase sigma factor (sigma-70 family)